MDKPWIYSDPKQVGGVIYSSVSLRGPSRSPLRRHSLGVHKWQLTDGDLGCGSKCRCSNLTAGRPRASSLPSPSWAQEPGSGCTFAGQGGQRPGTCTCLLRKPVISQKARHCSSLPCPAWLESPPLPVRLLLGGRCWKVAWGTAWRAGSEPTRHQDGGKGELRCRREGWASCIAKVGKGMRSRANG